MIHPSSLTDTHWDVQSPQMVLQLRQKEGRQVSRFIYSEWETCLGLTSSNSPPPLENEDFWKVFGMALAFVLLAVRGLEPVPC